MATIQMIAGTFGLRKDGRIQPMRAEDGPFDVDKKSAERLIKLGVARVADVVDVEQESTDAESEDVQGYEALKHPQLQALCEERGIEYKKRAKKTELIALLESYDQQNDAGDADEVDENVDDVDEDASEQPPDVSTADPIV